MISLIKYLWDRFGNTAKKNEELQERFEKEQRYLDDQYNEDKPVYTYVDMYGAKTTAKGDVSSTVETTSCYKHNGVVTTLTSDHGTIDNSIFFDANVALAVFADLHVGCRVEYLAYQQANTECIKVVNIIQIIDQCWDDVLPTEVDIQKQIEVFRSEQPTYFHTQQRNILGLVTERKKDSLLIDTDYKILNVEIDKVRMNFKPMDGDRVFMVCNIQADEHFVDKQGEILEVLSIQPARLLKAEKRIVQAMHANCIVLNDNTYYMDDIAPNANMLQATDIVSCDLIECDRGNFIWRALNIKLLERVSLQQKEPVAPTNENAENNIVTVSEHKLCILSSLTDKQEFEISITNNRPRIINLLSVEILGKRRNPQLELLHPKADELCKIPARATIKLRFQVIAKTLGESLEAFSVKFEHFRVKRTIKVIVCETEEKAKITAEEQTRLPLHLTLQNKVLNMRHQARQLYARKGELIPGVQAHKKPRFVQQKIGIYEIPQRLREVYLSNDSNMSKNNVIQCMFPHLAEELNINNYASRFQTLLHLEELDCFVNFRTFDRERAHFSRDGEFLVLEVPNLAEQRPSLVLGDVVHAINPWIDDVSEQPRYQGIIHKVLFDRVLIKFSPLFHSKYNGEDYRLEFYFSRFSFRKQHYAAQRAPQCLGEQFLFPTKIEMRNRIQLDAELADSGELCIDQKPVKWYNDKLNSVQKRAICNILRGEAIHMPYIIFGPPGTGKTLTVVETILQMLHNLSSARIIVATPSNSSADLICTRLIESGCLQPGAFIRLVSQNQIEKELIPSHLLPYCCTCDVSAEGTAKNNMITTETGLKLRCQLKYLGNHRVIISTCATIGNFIMMGFPADHFTHVIIDECGQSKECEAMIPMVQVSHRFGQVILAGDPHQLQPLVINRFAFDSGLSTSYLERVLRQSPYIRDKLRFPDTNGFDPRLVTKLIYNYRALPSVLYVYNKLFYDGELISQLCEQESREAKLLATLETIFPVAPNRRAAHGVFFYGIRGENKQESDSPSWFNPMEAKHVFLTVIKLYRLNIKPANIGIITPYIKQLKHLRTLFLAADIVMPKIGTVEEFQGQERDIIIISTVRSTSTFLSKDLRYSLGFVRNCKRMNVSISRARCLNIIFGNPHLLELDESWRFLIKYCLENDAYSGCDLPESFASYADT